MISVKEAQDIIREHVGPLPAETFSLKDTAGLSLAEDIYATNDFPPFPQSSMDGYAFCFKDWNNEPLQIAGEVPAGATQELAVTSRQAVRIFTGAPVPAQCDTVVMQEKVEVHEGLLFINDPDLQRGSNVRPKGSEMASGSLALSTGTLLTPGAIGFIAGLGKSTVKATRKPSVSIVVTGKELQQVGKPLLFGQVYESNSFALTAALQSIGVAVTSTQWADDNIEELTGVIQSCLSSADLLLITGGVSVGDYDFVSKALEQVGVEKLFHKIKQKPGKPLLFGKKDNTIVFGLPGNPSSVLTCFYEYVLIAIQQMMNFDKPFLTSTQLKLANDYSKKAGLKHFLKGKRMNDEVIVLDAQESYKMRSFALTDCLVVLEEERTEYKKGEMLEVHLLP
jgi:molybdopterin molybdotransferase